MPDGEITVNSALRKLQRGMLYPSSKPSLVLIVPRIPQKEGRESVAQPRLYFVGYVTMNPEGIAGTIGEGFVVEAKSRYVSPTATSSTPMSRLSGCRGLQGDSLQCHQGDVVLLLPALPTKV